MKHALCTAILLGLFISGCSIYRSEGRKQFESEAPGKVATKVAASQLPFQLTSCKTEGRLEAWFNEEFPSQNYELVISEQDLEIWHARHDSMIEVKAIQKNGATTQSCTYLFTDEAAWNIYKDQFILELENNMMTQE